MSRYYIIPDRENIEESLTLAAEYGLGFEFDDFWSPSVLADSNKTAELVKFYSGYDLPKEISVHGDFFDVCIFSADSEIVAVSERRIIQSMEAAVQMGASKVIFHSNINPFLARGFYLDNWVNKNEAFFRQLCKQYPQTEVLMENMFDDGPGALAILAKRMNDVPNFNICFDFAHAFISPTPVSEWAAQLSPYIRHVHINDNNGKEDLHLALGRGVTDFDRFEVLRKQYFNDATVLIEVSQLEAQKESIAYLKSKGLL